MKKAAKLLLILMSVLMLSGCGDDYAINSQENDLIAEYIAGTVLKYNGDGLQQQQQIVIEQNKDNNKDKETKPSAGNQNPTQGGNQNPTQSGGQSGTQGATSDSSQNTTGGVMEQLASGLGLNSTVITYTGYQKGDKYPMDGLFSVPANSNHVVFGFEFDIKNNTGADMTANTEASPIIFKLVIDGETKVQSSTILANDMTSLKNVTIKAGDTFKSAVVFQIPKAISEATSGMDLQVYSNGKLLGSVPGVKN